MGCTIVFYHDRPEESLTLRLSDQAGAAIGPDTLVETDPSEKPLRYEATVSESLAGWYTAQVFDHIGLLYTGRVKVANDDGIYLIGDPAATVADLGDIVIDDVNVKGFTSPALQQLAGTRIININVPALRGSSLTDPLIQGDTYSAALGSAIEFSRSDFPDLPVDATAKLTARKTHGETEASFSIDGSLVVRTGAKVVRFEATAAESRLWKPGTYEFDVSITWTDGATRTFVGPRLTLQVIADVTV